MINKSGAYVWIESTAKAIFDQKTNQLQEIITVSRDCTDQVIYDSELKRAKAKLETSNQLISNVIESITDGFFAVDYNGNIIFLNSKTEQIAKKKRQDLIGTSVWDQFPFLEGSEFERKFFEYDDKLIEFEKQEMNQKRLSTFTMKTIDDSIRDIEVTADKVFYKGQPAIQFIARDITERKKYEEFLNTNALLKNVQLQCEFESSPLLTLCDKHSLKQVFINILQNALEATNEKGKIEIKVRLRQVNYIEISCKDNGCGIPKHLIHRLGEPFYSLKEKGTGLGLMICFKIIENHNGSIRIESEEGEGTAVIIRLPLLGRKGEGYGSF